VIVLLQSGPHRGRLQRVPGSCAGIQRLVELQWPTNTSDYRYHDWTIFGVRGRQVNTRRECTMRITQPPDPGNLLLRSRGPWHDVPWTEALSCPAKLGEGG